MMSLFMVACTVAETPEPTPTIVPTSMPPTEMVNLSTCNADAMLAAARAEMGTVESSISFNSISGVNNLNVWYVDTDIDASDGAAAADEIANRVRRNVVELAIRLNNLDPCIGEIFGGQTFIAVDQDYNSWFIGALSSILIPTETSLTDESIENLTQLIEIGYLRSEEIQPYELIDSEENCQWPVVRKQLKAAFGMERMNVSFYYYIDEEGGNIWAQWDVPPGVTSAEAMMEGFVSPLASIDEIVSCLESPLDTLWLVYVFTDGEAQLIAAVDGEAVRNSDHEVFLNSVEIIYPGNS
jgi:hypothetical protein